MSPTSTIGRPTTSSTGSAPRPPSTARPDTRATPDAASPGVGRSAGDDAAGADGRPRRMSSGLLWYDPDPRKPAATKIDEAARRYREKFGAEPTACHVSPAAGVGHARLRIVGNRWIRPHYFWIGVEESSAAAVTEPTLAVPA